MRVLITAGPHQGQVLDMGTAQAAAALRDGWAVVPLPEGEPMVAHHDQVIPLGFLPATAGASEGMPRLEANEEVVPITPGALAPAIARAIAGEPEPAAEAPDADRTLEDAVEAERELATERDGTPVPTKRRKR